MPTDVTSLHHVRVALARHDRANDGHAGQACDVGDDMIMAGTKRPDSTVETVQKVGGAMGPPGPFDVAGTTTAT
jgi:hypothetical protein